jgi:hypothetical protein
VPSAVLVLTAIPITVTPSAVFAPSSVLFDLVCAKAGEATSAQTSVINIFFIAPFFLRFDSVADSFAHETLVLYF